MPSYSFFFLKQVRFSCHCILKHFLVCLAPKSAFCSPLILVFLLFCISILYSFKESNLIFSYLLVSIKNCFPGLMNSNSKSSIFKRVFTEQNAVSIYPISFHLDNKVSIFIVDMFLNGQTLVLKGGKNSETHGIS